ncbi:hypothetical protein AAFF_G00369480 [Aldrovandia affinis]|uniref:Uncharacterized protein n=1 Tax=Aldrovandia affinis TaxID=143900 RepID=A0AAD7SH70_9TELE|nr:hypothetical protein AAFF_G00369480 [Aldrovandia affinis]
MAQDYIASPALITISPFAGESDICPRDNSFSLHELRFTNTSIHMNMGNVYRLSRALFPPEPEVLAEMCQNGYKDALRFLRDNNLLKLECPTAGLPVAEVKHTTATCCCSGNGNGQSMSGKPVVTETTKEWVFRRLRLLRKQHWWLDEHIIDNLPMPLKKVFCEACREKHGLRAQVTGLLPVRMASYMLLPCTLPVESAYSVAQRLVEWMPEVTDDVKWLCGMAGTMYMQTRKGADPNPARHVGPTDGAEQVPTAPLHGTPQRTIPASNLSPSASGPPATPPSWTPVTPKS